MPASQEAPPALPPGLRDHAVLLQKGEITEYHIYRKLASLTPDPHNRSVLQRMADEELGHYLVWKQYTGVEVSPDRARIFFYSLVSRLFGLTFGIKLMEMREAGAIAAYRALSPEVPEAAGILRNEEEHEAEIIALIDEKRLQYVGSVVLGINDALVEFTGSLAGFTLALQDTRLIAAAGLIMGAAASLSMGASEYLSQKSEISEKDPLTAAIYTGGAYVLTVAVLILPFLLLSGPIEAYLLTLTMAILIIVLFTFYTSVAKDLPFLRRFGEMVVISLGIAAISFLIGFAIRVYLNVDV